MSIELASDVVSRPYCVECLGVFLCIPESYIAGTDLNREKCVSGSCPSVLGRTETGTRIRGIGIGIDIHAREAWFAWSISRLLASTFDEDVNPRLAKHMASKWEAVTTMASFDTRRSLDNVPDSCSDVECQASTNAGEPVTRHDLCMR